MPVSKRTRFATTTGKVLDIVGCEHQVVEVGD